MSKKNLSLATQMWLPVAVLVSTMTLTAVVSMDRTRVQIAETGAMQQRQAAKLELVNGWHEGTAWHAAQTQAVLLAADDKLRAALLAQQRQVGERLQKTAAQLAPLLSDDDEKASLDHAAAALQAYLGLAEQALGQGRAPAGTWAEQSAAPLATLQAAIDKANQVQLQKSQALRDYMGSLRIKNSWATVGVMVVMALAIAAATAYLVRTIINPVKRLVQIAETIGAGDLSHDVVVDRGDELGTLQQALRRMRNELADMVRQAREGADSVQTAAAEIAVGNADLSQRTEIAAAHVQKTDGVVSDLGAAVRKASGNADTANQLAQNAAEVARRSGSVVGQVVSTMSEINASSKKIADIIGVIDGIAFQTNILALNAAVEAARAGEQGRGFSVVASEVRSLAGRSAEAAKEIKTLIGASVDRVEAGSRLVQDAGQTMGELVDSVQRVSQVIAEISAGSAQQSAHLSGVATSMNELDHMSQSNAALVEQGAAAAESLKEQAVRLHQLVSRYRVSAVA